MAALLHSVCHLWHERIVLKARPKQLGPLANETGIRTRHGLGRDRRAENQPQFSASYRNLVQLPGSSADSLCLPRNFIF